MATVSSKDFFMYLMDTVSTKDLFYVPNGYCKY